MVATTTSSFIPSVSTLMAEGGWAAAAGSEGGGEGGGVCAAREGREWTGLAGEAATAAATAAAAAAAAAAAGSGCGTEASLCDLFNFLDGGGREFGEDVAVVVVVAVAGAMEAGVALAAEPVVVGLELVADGGERCDEGRGTWMPNKLRLTLLRRVL
jgi:type IV secretory pathway VirB2 component (pilin)